MPTTGLFSRDDYISSVFPETGTPTGAGEILRKLGVSKLEVTGAGLATVSRLKFAQVTQLSFNAPELSIVWPRSRARFQNRRLFLLVNEGTLEATVNGTAARASWELPVSISPGTEDVTIQVLEPGTKGHVLSVHEDLLPRRKHSTYPAVVSFRPPHASFRAVLSSLLASTFSTVPRNLDPASCGGILQLLSSAAQALTTHADRAASDSHSCLYRDALAVIALTSSDPQTTPQGIANSLGVSLRTLQKRFTEQGESVASVLRRTRAFRAAELMEQHPDLTLQTVAIRSGFSGAQVLRRNIAAALEPSSALRSTDGEVLAFPETDLALEDAHSMRLQEHPFRPATDEQAGSALALR